MLKHKRFVKIVSSLLIVSFILLNVNLNAIAAPVHGTANVATGTGSRTKCLCL